MAADALVMLLCVAVWFDLKDEFRNTGFGFSSEILVRFLWCIKNEVSLLCVKFWLSGVVELSNIVALFLTSFVVFFFSFGLKKKTCFGFLAGTDDELLGPK